MICRGRLTETDRQASGVTLYGYDSNNNFASVREKRERKDELWNYDDVTTACPQSSDWAGNPSVQYQCDSEKRETSRNLSIPGGKTVAYALRQPEPADKPS